MRQHDLRILAGAKHQPAGYRFATDRYEQFQVIYVESGALQLRTPSSRADLSRGAAAVLPAGSEFRLASPRGYAGVFCIAAGAVCSALRGEARLVVGDERIRTLAGMMLAELQTPCEDSTRLLESLGYALAWRSVRCSVDQAGPVEQDAAWWAHRAARQIEANIYSSLSCRQALAPLSRSYRQLARCFQATWSMSPKRYQLQAKLAEARRLLETTELSVTTISVELGFSSSQHLATAFKAVTGTTPSACRRPTVQQRARAETRAR